MKLEAVRVPKRFNTLKLPHRPLADVREHVAALVVAIFTMMVGFFCSSVRQFW